MFRNRIRNATIVIIMILEISIAGVICRCLSSSAFSILKYNRVIVCVCIPYGSEHYR